MRKIVRTRHELLQTALSGAPVFGFDQLPTNSAGAKASSVPKQTYYFAILAH
jgi:hypothetical protein